MQGLPSWQSRSAAPMASEALLFRRKGLSEEQQAELDRCIGNSEVAQRLKAKQASEKFLQLLQAERRE
jgi:hypothetical protein